MRRHHEKDSYYILITYGNAPDGVGRKTGKIGTSCPAIQGRGRVDLDKEERAALKVFKGLNKLIVIDFEEIPQARKATFATKVEKILDGMDLILESKDKEETFRIYGIDDGKDIRDCILYSSDGSLIVTKGRFSLDAIGKLMEMAE